jgi:hypothetical protein
LAGICRDLAGYLEICSYLEATARADVYKTAPFGELLFQPAVRFGMEKLREFRLTMVGAENAPARPISVLAATPTIALIQGATIAIGYGARDFSLSPGKRRTAA